ncbi:MAG: helix-turn-helix transcriptional regulator [Halieaceae bacterium]|nr:helix-turn-helix transcriptional regulator [Halieaceae bacterium]
MSSAEDITESGHEFLQQVGSRVRGRRASLGMTRKMLAHDSTVSERYLANLEQGKGNISINLLRQVAEALRTGLADLLPSDRQQTPEQSLINELVGRLSTEDQKTALQTLYQNYASTSNAPTRVALIGLRGAGKTTLGQLLHRRQQLPFVRLVDEIESIAGMAISEVLSLSGQRGYRRLEEKALIQTLDTYQSCCIEAGGGIVSEPKALNLLLTTCLVIWIRATPEEHMSRVIAQGDLRPMADNRDAMKDLHRILEERKPYYEKAHATLDTSGKSIEQSYGELEALIQKREQHSGAPTPGRSF